MATKKQKREAALTKREAFMAEIRESGLKALEEDRKRRKEAREDLMIKEQASATKARAILKSAFIMSQVH